jgi:hypothetical protein
VIGPEALVPCPARLGGNRVYPRRREGDLATEPDQLLACGVDGSLARDARQVLLSDGDRLLHQVDGLLQRDGAGHRARCCGEDLAGQPEDVVGLP